MVNRKTVAMVLGLALIWAPAVVVLAQQDPPAAVWEPAPAPPNWSQPARDGYQAGVDAARKDIAAGRSLNPDRHEACRHPDLPSEQRADFRMGFRRGYREVVEHRLHPDRDRDGYGPGL